MGLTIHYTLTLPGETSVDAVKAKLDQIRQRCLDLPVEKVDAGLQDYKGNECGHERIESLRELKAPADQSLFYFLCNAGGIIGFNYDDNGRPRVAKLIEAKSFMFLQPSRLIGFTVIPGPGCEWFRVRLVRLPKSVLVKGDPTKFSRKFRLPVENADKWIWMGFCKTQYASHKGDGGSLENFLRCHLSIVAILDFAKQIGFEVKVNDEGGFWEKRDLQALCKQLVEYNEFIAAFGGLLKDAAETEDVKIQGPIFSNPEFERLEAKGRAKLAPKIDPKLFELIKTVIKHEKQAGQ
jgi:hypothetical protein